MAIPDSTHACSVKCSYKPHGDVTAFDPGSPIQTRGRCLRPGVSCFAKKPPPKKGSGGAAPRVHHVIEHCQGASRLLHGRPERKPATYTLQDGGGGFAPAQPPRPPPRIIDTSVLSLKTQKRLIEQRKVGTLSSELMLCSL